MGKSAFKAYIRSMKTQIETTYNPDANPYAPVDILLNGELGIPRGSTGGCRKQWRFPKQGVLMKAELDNTAYQSQNDRDFWETLPSDMRSIFTPCLASGVLEPFTVPHRYVWEREQGGYQPYTFSECGYSLSPWYDNLRDAEHAPPSIREQVDRVVDRLGVGDWCMRQWKVTPWGTPLIHDYGY